MKSYKLQALVALLIGLSIISCSDDDSDVIENIVDPIEETADDLVEDVEDIADEVTEDIEEETQNNEVLTGSFVPAPGYITMGNVTVNEERTQLTITNFASDLGLAPLELYLIADSAFLTFPESRNIGPDDFITLGVIQGQSGELFTYNLPEGIDFENFQYLSAWCVPARVNFGHALLE